MESAQYSISVTQIVGSITQMFKLDTEMPYSYKILNVILQLTRLLHIGLPVRKERKFLVWS